MALYGLDVAPFQALYANEEEREVRQALASDGYDGDHAFSQLHDGWRDAVKPTVLAKWLDNGGDRTGALAAALRPFIPNDAPRTQLRDNRSGLPGGTTSTTVGRYTSFQACEAAAAQLSTQHPENEYSCEYTNLDFFAIVQNEVIHLGAKPPLAASANDCFQEPPPRRPATDLVRRPPFNLTVAWGYTSVIRCSTTTAIFSAPAPECQEFSR